MEDSWWIAVRDLGLLYGTFIATFVLLLQTWIPPWEACLGGFAVSNIVFLLLCRFRTSEPDWRVNHSRRDQL